VHISNKNPLNDQENLLKKGYFNSLNESLLKSLAGNSPKQSLRNEFTEIRNKLVHLPEYERINILKKHIEKTGFFEKKSSSDFQTPHFINQLLVSLTNPKQNEIVLDPAAGKCETLIEAYKKGNDIQIYGQEINADITEIGSLNLLISNCNNFKIFNENSLSSNSFKENTVDVIISNPPFKVRIDKELKLGFPRLSRDNSSDTLFFEMMLSKLKLDSGRMAVVVPDSFLNRSSNLELRRKIIEGNKLDLVISLPRGSFYPYTGVNTSLIVINNQKSVNNKSTLFINGFDSVDFQIHNMEIKVDLVLLNKFVQEIIDLYERNKVVSDIVKTKIVSNQIIAKKSFNFSPDIYTSGIIEIIEETKKTENLLELNEILKRTRAYQINKGDEKISFANVKDLQNEPLDFYLDTSKLNQLEKTLPNVRMLKESTLLISRVGNKLKPTYFRFTGHPIAINSNIVPFAINTEIVNIEYLLSQLNSDFFISQLDLIRSGAVMQSLQINSFLKLQIPVPSLSEQLNRLAIFKESQANKYRLIRFINEIKLVTTPEEIKLEIERFARNTLKTDNYIDFKREFDFEEFPFSRNEINKTDHIKTLKDKKGEDGSQYKALLLIDEDKRINGVLIVQTENEISFEEYSEINAYSNFIIQTSAKYIQQNTNQLLSKFNHSTKNMLKDIDKILKDFINTKNENFLEAMKTSYLKDNDLMDDLIKKGGRRKEDFLAINRVKEAYNIVNKHFDQFKRRHKYFTNIVNSDFEEIKVHQFIERVTKNDNRINISFKNENNETLFIKCIPLEMAFSDLIDNAIYYSSNEDVNIEISLKGTYVEFIITNKTEPVLSKDNYNRLGKEELKKDDGTYSTGLSNAFNCIKEDNDIILAPYEYYKENAKFMVTIKLKKK
jgi:type I restriction-modification system DNA methylase subunit